MVIGGQPREKAASGTPQASGTAAPRRAFWQLHIGRRIQMRREQMPNELSDRASPMSRDTLARQVGLPSFNVWEIENGIIPVDAALLVRFAEVLRVHPGWFFDTPAVIPEPTENARFVQRMAALVAPLSDGELDIVETVFRYLHQRRAASSQRA